MTDFAISNGNLTFTVGDVRITRIEESYGPAFPVDVFLPAFNLDAVDNHGPELFANYWDAETNLAYVSVHSWLVQTPRKTILIDTCNGNHKDRPGMPDMGGLETPWLDRLAAAGVTREDVDAVVCTHIHLDHVGWNTMLVDGEWVPTFPNAVHYFNQSEFDFWMPSNPAQEPFEFNANVFADSIQPVFDRDLVQLWTGDLDLDDVFTMDMAVGHTPGHHMCWLESKGERALFSGDAMHSPMQVHEPSWNCGFDADPDTSHATRVQVLEKAAEANALLLPAHFAAPHVYRVEADGNGMKATPITLS